jgi:hypothetical protein
MARNIRHAHARRWLGVLGAVVVVLAVAAYVSSKVGGSGSPRARNGHTGRTYYVSLGGSDSDSGTSPSHPWKTIGHVNHATLHAGDAVLFRGGGTFTDTYLKGNGGGRRGKPITYATYGAGNAHIRGIYVEHHSFLTYNHFTVHGAGLTSDYGSMGGTEASDITIENSTITDVQAGVSVISGDRWHILYDTIENTGDSGILTQVGDEGGEGVPGNEWVINNNVIRNTGRHDFGWGEHGIYLKCKNSEVSNNVIATFKDSGISQRYGNDSLINNKISNGAAGGIGIGIAFFPYDASGHTSHWIGNEITETKTGLYVPAHDEGSPPPGGTTKENFIVEKNTIGPLKAHGEAWSDMHSEGTITFSGNTLVH